jgi:hypothetical protein
MDMQTRMLIIVACACVALAVVTPLLLGAGRGDLSASNAERMVIKICNWNNVVPGPALDGFQMPRGKWYDFQRQGWRVESYVVAPNAEGAKHGFYAVLVR